MRVLVDEAMPVQVLEPLRLNKGHSFEHVARGQRVVEMGLLKAARRHEVFDPRADLARFPYWR